MVSSQQGTFTARDPFAGFDTQPYSLHPYAYAMSNPVLYTDPTGKYYADPDSGGYLLPCPEMPEAYVLSEDGTTCLRRPTTPDYFPDTMSPEPMMQGTIVLPGSGQAIRALQGVLAACAVTLSAWLGLEDAQVSGPTFPPDTKPFPVPLPPRPPAEARPDSDIDQDVDVNTDAQADTPKSDQQTCDHVKIPASCAKDFAKYPDTSFQCFKCATNVARKIQTANPTSSVLIVELMNSVGRPFLPNRDGEQVSKTGLHEVVVIDNECYIDALVYKYFGLRAVTWAEYQTVWQYDDMVIRTGNTRLPGSRRQ